MTPGFYNAGFLVSERKLAANILTKMYEWAKKRAFPGAPRVKTVIFGYCHLEGVSRVLLGPDCLAR
jgi:hypothetical protein